MKLRLHISIERRIYLGFFVLVGLFVVNGIITNITLNNQKKASAYLSGVVHPSLQAIDDFRQMMVESKMYTTNWVFLRYNKEDKDLLEKLHQSDYPALKAKITNYSNGWTVRAARDSMLQVFKHFEELLAIEKKIMLSLHEFADYDDPVSKLEAETKVEEEILPRTAALVNSMNSIYDRGIEIRSRQSIMLEKSSMRLRVSILVMVIAIIGVAIFLSVYLTNVIISPVKRISHIINEMGKGITRKIDYQANGDEIGAMVRSVNNLSDKLQATATFAHEIGIRNFKAPFQPLSEEDTLGKALIAMRENLKKGERNLEMKNRELERKNKELEQFAYVASHDLQEPLRTVSNFAELFQKQYHGNLDEKADKYITYMLQSSARMKVLITDLLEYSRIGRNKELERVDCNIILMEVLADLDAAIKEAFADIRSDHLPVVTGYSMEIKQLFQNLIFNAIKFRKKGTNPVIRISAEKVGEHSQFSFSDNGIGIAKEHHDRIFIIFQRLHTRDEYNGSGIGLSHCKKIVELHKGRIWLKSEPGEGTTFYFTI
ncbi:MAG: ATP-binding protein [Chitinophagaceae bacterium]